MLVEKVKDSKMQIQILTPCHAKSLVKPSTGVQHTAADEAVGCDKLTLCKPVDIFFIMNGVGRLPCLI